MFNPNATSIDGQRLQHANDLFLLGRALAKSGDYEQARLVLKRALNENRDLSDAWLWLAYTTDDPADQRQDLDWAIAADPANRAARRWLALLNGKLLPKDVQPLKIAATPSASDTPEAVTTVRTFTCRKCGGSLRFDPESTDLKCQHCGTIEVVVEVTPGGGEQILDYTLPTQAGHAWAEAQRRQTCQQCGAVTIFPPGLTSTQCPFCGASAFSAAPEEAALMAPQGLVPMRIEAPRAEALLKEWLGRGFFAPDDLMGQGRRRRVRPAYLPVWIFNFDATVHWQGMVATGAAGRDQRWEWRKEQRTFFFKDFLQPGVRALSNALFRKAEPYNLAELVEPKPEYLAGWPAVIYDVSLADATVGARGEAAQSADKEMRAKAAPGRSLRNFAITGHDFTGETFRLALLPVWLGGYAYGGKTYQVLINGQTGQVAGDKPVDKVKVAAVIAAAFFVLVLLGVLLAFLTRGG
jgi:hypothetical protein